MVFSSAEEAYTQSVNKLVVLQEVNNIEEAITTTKENGDVSVTVSATTPMTDTTINSAQSFHSPITITGTVNSPTVTIGDSISLNSKIVTFTANALGSTTPSIANGGTIVIDSFSTTIRSWAVGSVSNPTVTKIHSIDINGTTVTFWPNVLGTVTNPTVSIGHSIDINGTTITFTGTSLASVISDINGEGITGITAYNLGNQLYIIDTSSNNLVIVNNTGTGLTDLGITAGTYVGTTLDEVVNQINNEAIANVTATNLNNQIYITENAGNDLVIANDSGTGLTDLGLVPGTYEGTTLAEVIASLENNSNLTIDSFRNESGALYIEHGASFVINSGTALSGLGLTIATYNGTSLQEVVNATNTTDDLDILARINTTGGSFYELYDASGDGITIANDSGSGLTDLGLTAGTTETIDLTNNEINVTSHGFSTGDLVVFTTSDTLPIPLNAFPDSTYWIINVDANTFQIATTEQNALDGVAIDLATYGTNEHFVRKVNVSELFWQAWKGYYDNLLYTARMNEVIKYFENRGYAISRITNTATDKTFRWVVSWG